MYPLGTNDSDELTYFLCFPEAPGRWGISCVPLGCTLGLSALHFPSMCQEATDMTSLILSLQHSPRSDRWAPWLPSVLLVDEMSPLSQGLSCTFRGL